MSSISKYSNALFIFVIFGTIRKSENLKVFLPFSNKEYHPYLDEISKESRYNFVTDDYRKYNSNYAIVNIHWPEAIFGWNEPSEEDLSSLEAQIKLWKKRAKIVYTKHDAERIKGTTPNFTRLFQLIEENADVFVHLGYFSKKLYKKKYPHANHIIIRHPYFINSFKQYNKKEARLRLGIDPSALVIIAPGKIRSFKERDLLLKSFKAIKEKNKVLISNNMLVELRKDFPGRLRIRKWFDFRDFVIQRFLRKYKVPEYFFNYNFLNSEDLSLRMSAADVVFVPRMDILNSGNIFLGFTFGKMTIGPAIGNISEHLLEQNFPMFDPKSLTSAKLALKEGIQIFKSESPNIESSNKYLPQVIASQYDELFDNLSGE